MSAGRPSSSSDPDRGPRPVARGGPWSPPERARRDALIAAALALGGALAGCDTSRPRGPTPARSAPAVGAAPAPPPAGGVSAPGLSSVRPSDLCVTRGSVEALPSGRLSLDQPAVRAVLTGVISQRAELRFSYRGPTAEVSALGSGRLRRQIGLKLRAQDSCNVVYVMWRIDPEPGLVVSVKANPGQHAHAECGTGGYHTVKPRRAAAVQRPEEGSWHSLRADLDSDALEVLVDGAVVWEGALGEGALSFDGPVGVRTDNGRFEIELRAGAPPPGAPPFSAPGRVPSRCRRDEVE